MNATGVIATTSSTVVDAIVTAAAGSSSVVGRHSNLSDLVVGAHQIWNFIQGNLEKTFLYAFIGILIGIVGLLSVANILLRFKRKSNPSQSKNTITRPSNAAKRKDNKHLAKASTGINRAPSGGWTFHEECSKFSGVPGTPQSFTSSPLLPIWDVFVHVDSPHESPVINSMPKPFSHSDPPQAYVLTTQQQVQQIFLSHSLPQHGYTVGSQQLAETSLVRKSLVFNGSGHNASSISRGNHNNNNDDDKDEESIWVKRSQLRFENTRGSSSRKQFYLPEIHAPISEV